MAQNVKPEYVDLIQSWIGTDEEIERTLFWDKGDKYDDPEWQSLKPVDKQTAQLFKVADAHFKELKHFIDLAKEYYAKEEWESIDFEEATHLIKIFFERICC